MSTRAMSQHSNGTVFARSALEDDEGGEGDEGGGATVDEVMYTEEVVTFWTSIFLRAGGKRRHTQMENRTESTTGTRIMGVRTGTRPQALRMQTPMV